MDLESIFNKIYIFLGIPWLFLMIVTSRGYTSIKTLLLGLLILVAFIEFVARKKCVNKNVLIFLIIFILYYFLSLVWGIMNNYPFSISRDFALIQYYIITPIAVVLLSSMFVENEKRKSFLKTFIIYLTFLLVFLDLWKLLNIKANFPSIPLLNIITQSSDISTYGLTLRLANETSFFFLLPFVTVLSLDNTLNAIQKNVVLFSIAGGFIYCLLSGRKMLEIIEIISILFTISMYVFQKRDISIKEIIKLICLIALIFVCVKWGVNVFSKILGINNIYSEAYDTLRQGLSKNAQGVNVRSKSIKGLYILWSQSFLFGNGLNSYSNYWIANNVTKWSYEVFYNALLAQTGILGVLLLLIAIVEIIRNLIINFMKKKENYYLALAIAFVMFAFSAESNPMLYFVWPWTIVLVASGILEYKGE